MLGGGVVQQLVLGDRSVQLRRDVTHLGHLSLLIFKYIDYSFFRERVYLTLFNMHNFTLLL